MIGWISLGLLWLAYVFLLADNTKWLFIPVNAMASGGLFVHSLFIHDPPFMIVNGFITLVMMVKWVRRDYGGLR